MNWAPRLKRAFGIQFEGPTRCGGKFRVIARIEQPQVIAKILAHLAKTAPDQYQPDLPLGARVPPSQINLLCIRKLGDSAGQRLGERDGACRPYGRCQAKAVRGEVSLRTNWLHSAGGGTRVGLAVAGQFRSSKSAAATGVGWGEFRQLSPASSARRGGL
jgi:hypothetical protein